MEAPVTRAEVAAEARTWIETPFRHQQHLRGVGTDCGGHLGGVGVALGLLPADFWANAFAPFAGYARQPANGNLERVLCEFLDPIAIDDAGAGDILLMRFAREPQHVGILVPYRQRDGDLALVHALSSPSVGRVVEHRLDAKWRDRATAAFRFRGVA